MATINMCLAVANHSFSLFVLGLTIGWCTGLFAMYKINRYVNPTHR